MSRPSTPTADNPSTVPQDWWAETLPIAEQASEIFSAEVDAAEGDIPDHELVYHVVEELRGKREVRKGEVERQRDKLRALSRSLENQRVAAQRPATVPSEQDHQARISAMDQQAMGAAKQIRELEASVASTDAQLNRHKEAARDLELDDVEREVEDSLDSTVLRNRLYHDLGFLPVPNEADPLDPPAKILVRSDPAHDARVVKVDKNQDSQYLMANYLWDLVSPA